VSVSDRIITANTKHQVRSTREQLLDLRKYTGNHSPVPRQQSGTPLSSQSSTNLLNDRHPAADVCSVIKNRIARKDCMRHHIHLVRFNALVISSEQTEGLTDSAKTLETTGRPVNRPNA